MRLWLWLIMLPLLAACDPLTDQVNKAFPPQNVDGQREEAIATARGALEKIHTPNIMAGASLDFMDRVLESEEVKKQGVTKASLSGEEQLLKLELNFDRTFTSKDVFPAGAGTDTPAPALADGYRTLLDRLKPRIKGTVVVFAGITSGTLDRSAGATVLTAQVVPAFKSIHVDELTIAEEIEATDIVAFLADVLNRYADNITGTIARLPAMRVEVPAVFIDEMDPSRILKLDDHSVQADVRLTGAPVAVPVRLDGLAWLITDKHMIGVAELLPASADDENASDVAIEPGYEGLRKTVLAYADQSFGLPEIPEKAWVAVRKDLISYTVNDVLARAQLCLSGTADIAEQTFAEKIPMPNGADIDCSSTRDCSQNRSCDFPMSHDTRDCSACVLKKPWGGCAIRGNDPFCELQKGAQNDIYRADHALKVADCERLKAMKKAGCEAEKAGEKALCEVGKTLLDGLGRTGNFANLDGRYSGKAALNTCLTQVAVSQDLKSVAAQLEVAGTASADVSLEFTPLDIVGHLACQVPWTDDETFQATVVPATVAVSSDIALTEDGSYEFAVAEASVPLSISPGPTEYLVKNKNLTLSCQGLNLIKPLLVAATPFVPELEGRLALKQNAQKVSINMKLPTKEVFGLSVTGVVSETDSALLLMGQIVEPPQKAL